MQNHTKNFFYGIWTGTFFRKRKPRLPTCFVATRRRGHFFEKLRNRPSRWRMWNGWRNAGRESWKRGRTGRAINARRLAESEHLVSDSPDGRGG
ncbi:MAG: hypothetical protein ACYTFW_08620 [Planctomycetota bacterium]